MSGKGKTQETDFHILVVDDEIPVLEVMSEMLQGAGWKVDTTPSAGVALQRVKRTRYDALVVDLYMPELPGLLLHSKLKFIDRELWNRTIFVSGHFSTEELRQSLEGTPRFVAKPFMTETFVGIVGMALPEVPRAISEPMASARPENKPVRS